MRGRTNIPPRMGGIVTGIVTECTVADESGIAVGDYVELVSGSGILDSESNTLYTTLGTWAFGPFILSDGSIATFYFYDKEFGVRKSTVGTSGLTNEGVITKFDLTELNSPKPDSMSYDDFYVVEIEQNNFLLMISDMGVGGFAKITYNNDSFSFTVIQSNAEFIGSSTRPIYSLMCMIDSTHIAVTFSDRLYIGVLSDNTLTFGSYTTLGSSNTNMHMEMLNGYLVILKKGYFTTLLIDVDGLSSSIVNYTSSDSFVSPTKGCISKLDSNRLIIINTKSNSHLYTTIVTINGDGVISTQKNTQAIALYGASTGLMNGTVYTFEDGRLLLIAVLSSGSSSSYTGYVYASTGFYDSNTGTATFNEPTLQNLPSTDWKNSSRESGAWYLPLIKLSNGLIYGVVAVGTHTRQLIIKVEQDSIIELSDSIFVKKYASKINGVAKTSGENGSVIEVYAPETLS